MTPLTKLLPPGAAPAKIILERAGGLVLTSAERAECPKTITTAAGEVSVAVEEMRPLEVGDVFVDDAGAFWVVQPAVEQILHVTGDIDVMREAVAALINRGSTIAEGMRLAQEAIDGSRSILVLTQDGIYAARDRMGRTPVIVGKKEGAYCVTFESFAYLNLGYTFAKSLGPGEIDRITPEGAEVLLPARDEMKICTFLWVYYGNPAST